MPLETNYSYENGEIVTRIDEDGQKKRYVRQHVTSTGEVVSGKGPGLPCLYKEDILRAHPDEPVYWVEGEKCVDFLIGHGFVSTTSIGGASAFRASEGAARAALRGRSVVIFPDNDTPGRNYAEEIVRALKDDLRSLRVAFLPGLEQHGDIVDFFRSGGDFLAIAQAISSAPELSNYRPIPITQILALPLEEDLDGPKFWVVPGFVPRAAVTILAGPPKVGKTLVALDMGLAVCSGGKFLSHFEAHKGRVLLILEEDPKHVSIARLRAMSSGRELGPTKDLEVIIQSGMLIDDPEQFQRLKRELDVFNPDLVVTDALSRVHTADENSRNEMQRVLRPLHLLCNERQIGMVLLHHVKKIPVGVERPDVISLLRGSGDIPAQARSIIGVFREGEGLLEVEVQGNNETPDPFLAKLITRTREGRHEMGFRVLGPKQAAATEACIPLIEKFLMGCQSPAAIREIRAAIGKKQDYVIHALRLMEGSGAVRRMGRGYAISGNGSPESGNEAVTKVTQVVDFPLGDG